MNRNMVNILRFLFPEMQIVDAAREQGFIARRRRDNRETVEAGTYTVYNGNTAVQQRMDSVLSTSAYSAEEIHRTEQGFHASSGGVMNAERAEQKFEGFEREFRNHWIGMPKDVRMLCQAFKRPFVMGYDLRKTKNNILITGTESRGKVTAAAVAGRLLKQRGIISYPDISKLDMSAYQGKSDSAMFTGDLQQALAGPSEIVVFEDIEQINAGDIDTVIKIISEGFCRLPAGNTGRNLVLSARGKYFIFTSSAGETRVSEILGQDFIRKLGDIICLEHLGEDEIREVIKGLTEEFRKKTKQHLQIRLEMETTFTEQLRQEYSLAEGIRGLQINIEENIYKPLAEYRLQNPANGEERAVIGYEDGYFMKNGRTIWLKDFQKRYDEAGIEQVKQELAEVIGLDSVKEYVLNLENNLKVQQLRESRGLKAADISMHMIFTGNPGTGKTTIARIVAKYLKAIGVLTSGQLREVSRSELVGQYVGHTAVLTSNVIKSAIGGVLFIDEAYALCRDENDMFGVEAIDTLVKGMEDNRDNLVVILAGYEDEMEDFIRTNPGLKSRFPNQINFEDYTPEEMYRIAEVTVKSKGYVLAEDCREPLLEEFEKRQIRGRNDSGNGRLVRNLTEAAILKQSQRIVADASQNLELLTSSDFGLEEKEKFDLEKALKGIIGLEQVKSVVRSQYNVLLAQEKRKKAELKVDTTQSLNMIFSGNPGTGKTTIARVVAEMFHAMGLLKSGHLVETDRGGLVAEYVGHTAKKTEEVFKSALGGVLFVDEAYAITNDGGSFGQECIDTLVKLIEDFRGEILVILAGYTKEMKDFMKANSGLESRFPLQIEFPDYTAEELFEIGKDMIQKKGFCLSEAAVPVLKEEIFTLKKHSRASSGNGRMIRNFVEEIVRRQSGRIAVSDVSEEDMILLIPEDIASDTQKTEVYDLEQELSGVIGLESVKRYIRSLNARLKVQEERRKQGMKINSTQTLHMIFMGNPGTGKTMMARTVANVLANMGVIHTNKLVETDRSGLVAGYVGQTAMKTREVTESALDGVLFIDEAYSLAQGGENDFGKEAIDTLVKMMDDNRDRLVVILAGYSHDMQNFLAQNAGLESRFPNIIEFEDYGTDELMAIAGKMYSEQGYMLHPSAEALLRNVFETGRKQPQFGNGRFVRNVFEKSLNAQALRLSSEGEMDAEDLMMITENDIREVISL